MENQDSKSQIAAWIEMQSQVSWSPIPVHSFVTSAFWGHLETYYEILPMNMPLKKLTKDNFYGSILE